MKEVGVMSILLILLATFFAALTVWAGCHLRRLLGGSVPAADRRHQAWACIC